MSIKTKHNPIGGVRYYTLTISTTPTDATCTLTYLGVSYSTKSLKVRQGSVVSYTVSHNTYGTSTGSITINDNKTLVFTGVTTPTTKQVTWSRPKLTSNGTMNNGTFACKGGSPTAYDGATKIYYAFDNGTSTAVRANNGYGYMIYWDCPSGITLTKIGLASNDANGYLGNNSSTASYRSRIEMSKNNSSWELVTTVKTTNTVNQVSNYTVNINTTTYPHFRLYMYPGFIFSNGQWRINVSEITLSGTKKETTYSYSWTIT